MPTGYTADVADGNITDFTEYALQCARNFGACVMLRDEPLSSDIPIFEPSDYHQTALEKARQELIEFESMTKEQRLEFKNAKYDGMIKSNNKIVAEKKIELKRYEAMLEKARAYKSPSPDHDNYAKFLVEQLEESIKWDCDTSYYENTPEKSSFEYWETETLGDLHHSIARHEKEYQKEIERINTRNEWVFKLKESLGMSVLNNT